MIVIMISGGLGNQMFQYAFAKALAEKGQVVYLDTQTWWREAQHEEFQWTQRELALEKFNITIPAIECKDTVWKNFFLCYNKSRFKQRIMRWYRRRSEQKKGVYFYERGLDRISLEELAKTKQNYYINSYFQNQDYFADCKSKIRIDFTLKKNFVIENPIRELLANRVVVALHVRRGDYVQLGESLDKTYYERAVEYLAKRVENPVFFLFSDDLPWTKELDIPYETIYINQDRKLTDYEELMLMSQCHHFIISNSTFSWWGAWLSQTLQNKMVIAPKIWFHDGTGTEIVPKEWVRL